MRGTILSLPLPRRNAPRKTTEERRGKSRERIRERVGFKRKKRRPGLTCGGAASARRNYFTSRLGLVISGGIGSPIISRIVGATEERMPSFAILTPSFSASFAL